MSRESSAESSGRVLQVQSRRRRFRRATQTCEGRFGPMYWRDDDTLATLTRPAWELLLGLVERDRKLVGHIRSCVVTWIERFWGHVDRRPSIESCWPWRGGIVSRLGRAPVGRYMDGASKSYRPHRLAWEFVIGTIPAGKIVVQTCSNTLCCNPRHLMLRGRRGLKQKRVLPQ